MPVRENPVAQKRTGQEEWSFLSMVSGLWPLIVAVVGVVALPQRGGIPREKKKKKTERERRENASKIKLGALDRFLFLLSRKLSRH